LNGYTSQENTYTTHALLIDYGDAAYYSSNLQNGPTWTPQNVYQAAWGIGYDVPVPETYLGGQTQNWVNVLNSQGYMQFYGNMAQCSESDTLPTNTCWVQRDQQCQWSPYLGYSSLSTEVSQPSITYSTNIQWPADTTSGNNGCK